MTKILFVCLGNICRSPMAEFVFRDMVQKQGLGDRFSVASAAILEMARQTGPLRLGEDDEYKFVSNVPCGPADVPGT